MGGRLTGAAAGGSDADGAPGRARGSRHVWLVFLALAAVTQLPYLRAALFPPPGRVFVGTFHWIDDVYNYVSFVQQAQSGHFFFLNKLVLAPHGRGLINLEWWSVGRLAALLGGHPFVAYRLLGLCATLALLLVIDRWAVACGAPQTHRLSTLVLVAVGGGLGGWMFEFADFPASLCPDFAQALPPFVEMLSNPHFVLGTALLAWALLRELATPDASRVGYFLIGTTLGLVRPYDLVTLAASRTLALVLAHGPRHTPRVVLSSFVPLLPVCAYNAWVFYLHPDFSFYAAIPYHLPSFVTFVPALGPLVALALMLRGNPPLDETARRCRFGLYAWVAFCLFLLLVPTVHFAYQTLVGVGLPLLLLAAMNLWRWRPAVTWLAAILLSFTSLVALKIVLTDDSAWFPRKERMDAALALVPSCTDDGLMLGPPEVGLYTIALTSCRAVLSHSVAPGFAERLLAARGFYGRWSVQQRQQWLNSLCVTHLVIPGDAGAAPLQWLGPSAFRRIALVGQGDKAISVYARPDRSSCDRP
jgi:hypothetical protein